MKKQRGTYLIRASIREMAADAIPQHIGSDRYALIKSHDQNPFFFAAEVAQEGVSTGDILGQGSREKIWPAGAIVSLTRRINESAAPVFIGHAGADRPSYGRMVSAFTENGRALSISYIELSTGKNKDVADRIQAGSLDTVSIEADIALEKLDTGELIVQQVDKVTGLALGDSRFNKPGFADSRVLASIQEFENDQNKSDSNEEDEPMKLQDIIAAIRENGFRPEQIFSDQQLLEAAPVSKALEQSRQETDKARKEAEKITGERDKLQKSTEELYGKLAGFESQGLVAARIKEAKLTEKTAKFVEKQLEGFTPAGKTEEERAKSADEAIQKQAGTFKEFFSETPGAGTAGSGSGETSANPTAKGDLTAPENNPFIPGSSVKIE